MNRLFLASSIALALLGSATARAQPFADLLVEASVAATADPGTDVSFSVGVTNLGPDDAADVTLSNPIPAGLTFVSLSSPPSWSCTTPAVGSGGTIDCTNALLASAVSAPFTIVLHVDASAAAGTYFTNVAHAQTNTPDPNDENDAATAVVQTPPPPAADLFVTIDAPSGTNPDTDVTYLVGVQNGGGVDASDVSLVVTLAGGMTYVSSQQTSGPTFSCNQSGSTLTCTLATLAAGAAGAFSVVGHVPSGTGDGSTYQTFASVSSDNDPNPENDQVPTLVCVQADSCAAGPCNSNHAVTCDAPDQCHEQSVCDPTSGTCPPIPKTDGSACDDASVCTQTDSCQAGLCVGASPMDCDDGNVCSVDTCDAITGCSNVGECDAGDGDAGTIDDAGQAGDSGTGGDAGHGADGGGMPPSGDDGGCNCSVAGTSPAASWTGTTMLLALLGATWMRRRRLARTR